MSTEREHAQGFISSGDTNGAGVSASVAAVSTKSDGTSLSRRKFLQILGAGSTATAAVGCTDRATQAVFPDVKGDAERIPGVAVWYSSTCTECSAGCGVQVRTREGRAVKIEGNPDSPINQGGLCALGQSALQSHYDPDRVRQPLKKTIDKVTGKSVFEPVTWDEALTAVGTILKDSSTAKAFVTGEVTGSISSLIKSFCDGFNVKHVVYDVTQPNSVSKASELVFGVSGVPTYQIDNAEIIVNFGADFLETWVSPCELARGWSNARRAKKPARFVHVEPRLSLTAANADTWLSARPGSEVRVALALLKIVLEFGRTGGLDSQSLVQAKALTSSVNLAVVSEESGVAEAKILQVARWLVEAGSSLILTGGASSASEASLPLAVVGNLLNLALGNVGKTVNLAVMRQVRSSPEQLSNLLRSIEEGEDSAKAGKAKKLGALFIHGTNPAFTLPGSFHFDETTLKRVPNVISFSSHLDETSQLADWILPASSSLESWGDAQPRPGVLAIIQPAMTPVFDTRGLGDIIVSLSDKAGSSTVAGGHKDYLSYIQAQWKIAQASLGIAGDFEGFWRSCVERGGYFAETPAASSGPKPKVDSAIFKLSFDSALRGAAKNGSDLVLYPFFSVKSFDGRAANRPWLQELPDPITTVMWDAWVEINPETAKEHGIAQGDTVLVRNKFGELNLPAFVTEHVLPGVLAVPIGQGHKEFGRFAKKVAGGDVFRMLPGASNEVLAKTGGQIPLLTSGVELIRGSVQAKLVTAQQTFDQEEREIAKMTFIGSSALAAGKAHASGQHGEGHGSSEHGEEGEGHGNVKQMYVQREHPVYQWGLGVDLSVCTGCAACVVACYAENNIPVVGKKLVYQGREMSWLRIERYEHEGPSEELQVQFQPMMCQHCHNAPCEPVCPVFATYHNEEGLNVMVYNRCVGTRYCSNNCSYKVRRFNFTDIDMAEPLNWQLNPDVSKRTMGMMEKCSFCVQRILEGKDRAKDEGRLVRDGEIKPACVQSCPTQALVFGNLNDEESAVSKLAREASAYKVLDHHINTQPAVSYLERKKYPASV